MRIVIASFAVVAALVVSGCGSDESGTTTTTDTGTSGTDTGGSTDTGSTTDTGGSTDTGSTADTGSTGDTGGETGPSFTVINGCAEADYVDATTDATKRKVDPWDITAGKKCIKIKKGQGVTWNGDFTMHPLAAFNGDTPSPITSTSTGTTATFTFANEGTFGFHCTAHASMLGAILVVP